MAPPPEKQLARALRKGDLGAALELSVSWWQKTRDPLVADLVDELSARCPTTPLSKKTRDAYQDEWLEQAATTGPEGLAPLLDGLTHLADLRGWAYDAFERRLLALCLRPDDPRTATRLTQLLAEAPLTRPSAYRTVLFLLARLGDTRGLDALEQLSRHPRSTVKEVRNYFKEELPATVATLRGEGRPAPRPHVPRRGRLPAQAPPLTAEQRQWISEQLDRRAQPRRRDDDAARKKERLLAQVFEDPMADAPRLVLADWLLEHGDPWGEFIQLQYKEARQEATRKDRARIEALRRRHQRAFLGELAPLLRDCTFERGFLASARLAPSSAAEEAVWQRAALSPLWATVKVLRKGRGSEAHYAALVLSSALARLEELDLVSAGLTRALGELPRELRVQRLNVLGRPVSEVVRLLERAKNLPSLRALSVPATYAPALRESRLLPRLERLWVVWSGFWAEGADLGRFLSREADYHVRALGARAEALGFELSLVRAPGGSELELSLWPAPHWLHGFGKHQLTVALNALSVRTRRVRLLAGPKVPLEPALVARLASETNRRGPVELPAHWRAAPKKSLRRGAKRTADASLGASTGRRGRPARRA